MRLVNRRPTPGWSRVLALAPFVAVIVIYMIASSARLADNPADKLLPSFASIGAAITRMAFTVDPRTGTIPLWSDTAVSLFRLLSGLGLATVVGLVLGLIIGLLPYLRSLLGQFVAVISMVPPLAILPILLITLGLDEASKIALIAIGIAPLLVRDISLRVMEIPPQLNIKAETLGASSWTLALRVVVPQILPRLIDAVRLQIGPAWLFLISAEAIASQSGLGYRIFLVRRYLAMDVILPYVAWITFLAFLMEVALVLLQRRAFPWFAAARTQS